MLFIADCIPALCHVVLLRYGNAHYHSCRYSIRLSGFGDGYFHLRLRKSGVLDQSFLKIKIGRYVTQLNFCILTLFHST